MGAIPGHVGAGRVRRRDGVQFVRGDRKGKIRRPELLFIQADHFRGARAGDHVSGDEDRLSHVPPSGDRVFCPGACRGAAHRRIFSGGVGEHASMDTVLWFFCAAVGNGKTRPHIFPCLLFRKTKRQGKRSAVYSGTGRHYCGAAGRPDPARTRSGYGRLLTRDQRRLVVRCRARSSLDRRIHHFRRAGFLFADFSREVSARAHPGFFESMGGTLGAWISDDPVIAVGRLRRHHRPRLHGRKTEAVLFA